MSFEGDIEGSEVLGKGTATGVAIGAAGKRGDGCRSSVEYLIF